MNPLKTIKSIISVLFLSMSVMLLMTAAGCEGPEGPAGADGLAGVDGIDGVDGVDGADGTDITDASCLRCHSDNELVQKRFELNSHVHSDMPALARGKRASCARCHSSEGFAEFITTGESSDRETVTSLGCNSCHPLHNITAVDSFSYELRVTGPVEYLTGDTETFGDGAEANTCLVCHSPRRDYTYYDTTPTNAADSVYMTSSHSGPHYGVTGSLIFGKGADDRNGTVALDQGEMLHATATCTTCHMGDGSNHAFAPNEDNCQTCHSGADDIDINGAATKIQDAIHALELEFVTLGALEDDGEGGYDQTASSSSPTGLTGVQFSAFWNYLILHSDHGSAYHNPAYAQAIINNAEENLGMTQTTW